MVFVPFAFSIAALNSSAVINGIFCALLKFPVGVVIKPSAVKAASLIPVDYHISDNIGTTVVTLTKPNDACFLKLQALTQNIRYRIDGEEPTATVGFQLAAGSDTLMPVNVNEINIIAEAAGGVYQAQWCR